jgi:hypothetical protein
MPPPDPTGARFANVPLDAAYELGVRERDQGVELQPFADG